MIYSKLKKSDNQPLSQSEHEAILATLSIFRKLENSYTYSQINGNGIWDNIPKTLSFEQLSDKNILDELRFYTHHFSGESVALYENDSCTPILDDHVLRFIKLSAPLPDKWIMKPPLKMGEVGWNVNGIPVNIDTTYYQEKLSLMYALGVASFIETKEYPIFLEIGGGYGALARHLATNHGGLFINIDLLNSLYLSSSYLAGTLPEGIKLKIYVGDLDIPQSDLICRNLSDLIEQKTSCIVLVPNFLANKLSQENFTVDLAINIQSLSEMSETQCDEYCKLISDKIGESGIFYEQNGNHASHGGCDTLPIINNHFKNLYLSDFIGITNLTRYYSNHDIIGVFDIGANVNVIGNFDVGNMLSEFQKNLNISILVKSFEPITRYMSRISMTFPDLSHPDIKEIYIKIGKDINSFGWSSDYNKNQGDRDIFKLELPIPLKPEIEILTTEIIAPTSETNILEEHPNSANSTPETFSITQFIKKLIGTKE